LAPEEEPPVVFVMFAIVALVSTALVLVLRETNPDEA
jgi:hypothetical protein